MLFTHPDAPERTASLQFLDEDPAVVQTVVRYQDSAGKHHKKSLKEKSAFRAIARQRAQDKALGFLLDQVSLCARRKTVHSNGRRAPRCSFRWAGSFLLTARRSRSS